MIGSGGKTTLLRILAEELSGTVILTTSTHILPFAGIPLLETDDIDQVRRALALHRVICMGTPAAEGKLTAPALPFSVLANAADHVIVEADGSKQLPLKAHASHEPVIPENTRNTVCVVGASGFGKPVEQTVHRPELFCARTGAHMSGIVTPELAAQGIIAEHSADIVVLNQAETISPAAAKSFADTLQNANITAICTSLMQDKR
ncbi:hypothetical protein BUFA31_26320 [Butyricicoccus faecihominis]|uniref:Selenium-dependent hydroxylase accessory protein YqeC n=1 Tax=Butyricicoccus faecihominis TaxID=1712515 RepID=A0ABQ1E3D5_9FIRM|nr:hypothetical protein BUFA31_26320 [Butyricicoccus faecihominis]